MVQTGSLWGFLSDGKNSEHLHAFPYPNIEDSTFHQTNYCSRLQTIRWFRRSDWKSVGLPIRRKELRTFSCFPLSQHIKMSLRLMVGAIPQELQGGGCCTWLLHIKQKYCIHQHAFLCSNIQHSTFHHLLRRWSPFLSREENVLQSLLSYNQILSD